MAIGIHAKDKRTLIGGNRNIAICIHREAEGASGLEERVSARISFDGKLESLRFQGGFHVRAAGFVRRIQIIGGGRNGARVQGGGGRGSDSTPAILKDGEDSQNHH